MNANKNGYTLFTDKKLKAGQFKGMFVCYCIVSNSLYCRVYVCLLRRNQIFVTYFVTFLSMIIYEVLYSLL